VDASLLYLDRAQSHTGERTKIVIVIAGNIDHAGFAARLLEDALQDIGMALGPIEAAAKAVQIDDVAYEVQHLAPHLPQEVEQQLHATSARSEVEVRQPNRTVALCVSHDASSMH
jgi:hypothetical protein